MVSSHEMLGTAMSNGTIAMATRLRDSIFVQDQHGLFTYHLLFLLIEKGTLAMLAASTLLLNQIAVVCQATLILVIWLERCLGVLSPRVHAESSFRMMV